MLDAVRKLERQDVGIDADRVAIVSYDVSASALDRSGVIRQELLGSLRAIPGVVTVGLADNVPGLSSGQEVATSADDSSEPKAVARMFVVSDGFVEALHMRVVSGRSFDPSDRGGILISETLARRLWPKGDAVGRHLKHGVPGHRSPIVPLDAELVEVIGVVADVRRASGAEDISVATYGNARHYPMSSAHAIVRTVGDPAIRQRVRDVLPSALIGQVARLSDVFGDTLKLQRVYMIGFTTFSALALGLATIGIWGIAAYAVGLRRGELAMRRALGASDRAVIGVLLRQSARSVLPGLALGGAAAWTLISMLRAAVPGTDLSSVSAPIMAAASLALATIVASYLPARRALSIEPVEALRSE
jgi:putative ABC transport system permease protein